MRGKRFAGLKGYALKLRRAVIPVPPSVPDEERKPILHAHLLTVPFGNKKSRPAFRLRISPAQSGLGRRKAPAAAADARIHFYKYMIPCQGGDVKRSGKM